MTRTNATAVPALVAGSRAGPFDGGIDAGFAARFAAATNDPSPRARSGGAVPAVALAAMIWPAQEAGRAAIVDPALQGAASGGLHGEHDIVLHRPVVPGEPLRTWVEGLGARPAGANSLVTLRYLTTAADGEPVAEQFWTTVYLGVTCAPAGEAPPAHPFPEEARRRPLAVHHVEADPAMPQRYAEVSGDWSAHHFDEAAARRSGSARPFLHGLCTMALCAQAVTALAGGDPARLRRIAVRFAAPVPVGEALDVRLYDAGGGAVAFEADSAGATVIAHGRGELR